MGCILLRCIQILRWPYLLSLITFKTISFVDEEGAAFEDAAMSPPSPFIDTSLAALLLLLSDMVINLIQ